jgi:two-component system, NarL family, invasion response regulator UvrY
MISKTNPIKLAIVDDHNLFRKGLIKLINLADTDNKYKILFEAENGVELKEKLSHKNMPDIILMDIAMPEMDGYEAVDWIKRSYPELAILVVSMLETKEAIKRMLKLKIKGYLTKDIKVEDMHNALEAIAAGGVYYTEQVAAVMAEMIGEEDYATTVAAGSPSDEHVVLTKLTQNEREFIKFSCTELTYLQISEKMNLSVKTIEGYRENLFHKFKVKNRVSLAMFAVRNGLVKP